MFKYLTESSSDEGELVFDPCIGSGTTAIASLELNRNYIGFEIDKEYFDKANNRISKYIAEDKEVVDC